MLFAAIEVTTVIAAILLASHGWLLGARLGDERGVIGWTLGGLALAAGTLFGVAA